MEQIVKLIGDILVLLLVAFPPFLYLYQYVYDKIHHRFIRVLVFIGYWGITLVLSNLIPAITVLFLIWASKKEKFSFRFNVGEEENNYAERRFRLDCSEPKWKFSINAFVKVCLWGILIKFAVTYINVIAIQVLAKYNITLENQEIINEFLNSNMWKSLLFFIIIVFCAPIVEEFVFRFWIYDRLLKKRMSRVLSALFSSLLFMSAHFNIQGAISFFLIGLVNCYLYEKRGYWAAVANHFMFNFISTIVLIGAKVFDIPIV